jgi:hypothetical protein
MRMVYAVSVFVLLSASAQATTHVVNPDGSGDLPTIQAAIDVSAEGDTIKLAEGVFTGPGNRDLSFGIFAGVMCSAGGDPGACILDLEGHPIGNTGFYQFFDIEGIGFENGSKLRLEFSGVDFRNCRFVNNEGAVHNTNYLDGYNYARFYDCEFLECSGSVISSGGVVLEGCLFEGNRGSAVNALGLSISNCFFIDNKHDDALISNRSFDTIFGSAYLSNCNFFANDVESCYFVGYGMIVELIGCSFVYNEGTAITSLNCGLEIDACTFAGNRGSEGADIIIEAWDEYYFNHLYLSRSIFSFRTEGEVLSTFGEFPPDMSVECTDIYGNVAGDWTGLLSPFAGVDGNFSEHPQFCNWTAGDVTLYSTSPCLPGGNDCGVLIGAAGEGCDNPTSVESPAPSSLALAAHPNPFNPKTRFTFNLPEPGPVSLAIYDVSGRRVVKLLDKTQMPAGEQVLDWSAEGLSSGIYLARLVTPQAIKEIKIDLLR